MRVTGSVQKALSESKTRELLGRTEENKIFPNEGPFFTLFGLFTRSNQTALKLLSIGQTWRCISVSAADGQNVNVRDDHSGGGIYEDFPPTDPSEGSFLSTANTVTRPPRPERPRRPEFSRPTRLSGGNHSKLRNIFIARNIFIS